MTGNYYSRKEMINGFPRHLILGCPFAICEGVTTVMNTAKKLTKILMCRPTYFDVKYSINPWMQKNARVDKKKAMKQWETLKDTIGRLGAEVCVMEPDGADQYPDLVFTANAAVVRNDNAYVANFFYPQRKGEHFFYDRWFRENGYRTRSDLSVPFEGAGDALWAGKSESRLVCGVGPRTDVRALALSAQLLYDEVRPFKTYGVRLIDPRFYHIDTCLCPLCDELAIYFPDAFDPVSAYNLSNEVELVPVPEKDANNFACNAVVIDKNVVMHQGSEMTAKLLERVGYTTHFVDMSEFLKSGGSAKCCTLKI